MKRGIKRDATDYNTFRGNVFGPGLTAENIDAKEFTTGGTILENTFDGSDIKGINGAVAWVAVKGNKWTLEGNTGSGSRTDGQGDRVINFVGGQGE